MRNVLYASLALALLGGGLAPAAWAAPPGGVPPGQAKKHDREHDRDDRREQRTGGHFRAQDREFARSWYHQEYRRSCPPGLAKKNNGCMPPGQARKWELGHRLPAGVVVYPVPQPVLVQLPPPPPRHRYVRVAGDILLIAVGTQLVVDAITDLTR